MKIETQKAEFKPITITLETEEEVRFMYSVMMSVGGDRGKSPRKYADKIDEALDGMGLSIGYYESKGVITFEDFK